MEVHSHSQENRVAYTPPSSNSSPRGNRDRVLTLTSILRVVSLDESLHASNIKRSERGKSGDRCVAFKEISIREYDRTIGDNPSCSAGPPIGIGWRYRQLKPMSLEKYENTCRPRRSQLEMRLSRQQRWELLFKDWGIAQHQIAQAIRESTKTKNKRRRTIDNLNLESIEFIMESAKRKFLRTILLQKRPSQQYKDMMVQANNAAAAVALSMGSFTALTRNQDMSTITEMEDDYKHLEVALCYQVSPSAMGA